MLVASVLLGVAYVCMKPHGCPNLAGSLGVYRHPLQVLPHTLRHPNVSNRTGASFLCVSGLGDWESNSHSITRAIPLHSLQKSVLNSLQSHLKGYRRYRKFVGVPPILREPPAATLTVPRTRQAKMGYPRVCSRHCRSQVAKR